MSKKKAGSRKMDRKQEGKYRDGIVVNAKTASQRQYILEIQNNDITFCTGPAGTGKTAVAVGMALQHLLAEQSKIDRIVVVRPVIEVRDESVGWLPGELRQKMQPWAAPIVDNMELFINPTQIKNLFWANKVEIVPIAYIRGRSLRKSFIIVDEAQNCNRQKLTAILTRIGEGSKMVVNGDLDQADISGDDLKDVIDKLRGMDKVGICEFKHADIVRNPMISEILQRLSA